MVNKDTSNGFNPILGAEGNEPPLAKITNLISSPIGIVVNLKFIILSFASQLPDICRERKRTNSC